MCEKGQTLQYLKLDAPQFNKANKKSYIQIQIQTLIKCMQHEIIKTKYQLKPFFIIFKNDT